MILYDFIKDYHERDSENNDKSSTIASDFENYFITPPTSINYAEINQPVPLKYFLGEGLAISTMDCVGTYSEIFEE